MTHVSKNPIEKDVYYQIFYSFNWLLTNLQSEGEMKLFLYDFLTKTERIMLAKRLAVALLVSRGYETKIITQVLHVSTATVYRVHEWVEHGGKGLSMGFQKLARHEKMQIFWEKVDKFTDDYFFRPTILPKLSHYK